MSNWAQVKKIGENARRQTFFAGADLCGPPLLGDACAGRNLHQSEKLGDAVSLWTRGPIQDTRQASMLSSKKMLVVTKEDKRRSGCVSTARGAVPLARWRTRRVQLKNKADAYYRLRSRISNSASIQLGFRCHHGSHPDLEGEWTVLTIRPSMYVTRPRSLIQAQKRKFIKAT